MDGNGRWATRRNLPRSEGHRQGARVLPRLIRAAPHLGIRRLTFFALSSHNWERPHPEVQTVLELVCDFLREQRELFRRRDVRVSVLGRRDRLPNTLRHQIDKTCAETVSASSLEVTLAVDYSSRATWGSTTQEIPQATQLAPDVDLLIRTGGERRLSDFLLWECAHAELVFLEVAWPDFTADTLRTCCEDFARRERRFGALPDACKAVEIPPLRAENRV